MKYFLTLFDYFAHCLCIICLLVKFVEIDFPSDLRVTVNPGRLVWYLDHSHLVEVVSKLIAANLFYYTCILLFCISLFLLNSAELSLLQQSAGLLVFIAWGESIVT